MNNSTHTLPSGQRLSGCSPLNNVEVMTSYRTIMVNLIYAKNLKNILYKITS